MNPDFFAVQKNGPVRVRNIRIEDALGGVVFQEMRQGCRIREIVDPQKINVLMGKSGPEGHSSYAPETVDAHFHCHGLFSPLHGGEGKFTPPYPASPLKGERDFFL
jgi:hypothetical protein